ncbi:MAG: hypothetical protein M1820_008098 [Bogoriella megaspora]|nr:MAG: hypothetical protein M1820_008098 [Bogoriella megaspora]
MGIKSKKRKRGSEQLSSSPSESALSRPGQVKGANESGNSELPSGYWSVREVLDEDEENKLFLLDWEGRDPTTGRDYTPTWEPDHFLTDHLKELWREKKEQNKERIPVTNEPRRLRVTKRESQQAYRNRTPITISTRPRKRVTTIESSPASSSAAESLLSGRSQRSSGKGTRKRLYRQTDRSQDTNSSYEELPAVSLVEDSAGGEDHLGKDFDILLSQKSFDRDEYASFSAPATQRTDVTSPAIPSSFSTGQPTSFNELEYNQQSPVQLNQQSPDISLPDSVPHRITFLQNSNERSSLHSDHTLNTTTVEKNPKTSLAGPSSILQSQATKSRGNNSASGSATEVSLLSPLSSPKQPSQNLINPSSISEPTTGSRPTDESYNPHSLGSTTESLGNITQSALAVSPSGITFTQAGSGSSVKIVPDSQAVNGSATYAPSEEVSTGTKSSNDTDESRLLNQSQNIPESSQVEDPDSLFVPLNHNHDASSTASEAEAEDIAQPSRPTSQKSSGPTSPESLSDQLRQSEKSQTTEIENAPRTSASQLEQSTIDSRVAIATSALLRVSGGIVGIGYDEVPSERASSKTHQPDQASALGENPATRTDTTTGQSKISARSVLASPFGKSPSSVRRRATVSPASPLPQPPLQFNSLLSSSHLSPLRTPNLSEMSDGDSTGNGHRASTVKDFEAQSAEDIARARAAPRPRFGLAARMPKLLAKTDTSPANHASPDSTTRSPSAIPPIVEPPVIEPPATSSTLLRTLMPEQSPDHLPQESPNQRQQHDPASTSDTTAQSESRDQSSAEERNGIETSQSRKDGEGPGSPQQLLLVLPMGGSLREVYFNEIKRNRILLRDFVDKDELASGSQLAVSTILDKLHQAVCHRDLLEGETLSEMKLSPQRFVKWDKTASVKLNLLAELIESLRDISGEIAIFVGPGSFFQLVERFFEGLGITTFHGSLEDGPRFEGQGSLAVRICDTSATYPALSDKTCLVIGLDHTFHPGLVPVNRPRSLPRPVRLVIANSIEHFELLVPQDVQDSDRLQILASAVKHFRSDCGWIPNDYPTVTDEEMDESQNDDNNSKINALANVVADLVKEPNRDHPWPVYELIERVADFFSETGDSSQSDGMKSLKRQLSESSDDEEHTPKRRRLSSDHDGTQHAHPSADVSDATVTHVSDSAKQIISSGPQASELNELRLGVRILQVENANLTKLHVSVNVALEALQNRYEDQRKQLNTYKGTIDTLEANIARAEKRAETFSTTNANLREKLTTTENDLKSAREALLTSTSPSLADLEAKNAQIRDLEASLTKSKKTIDMHTNDLGYLREEYHKARSTAAERGEEIDALTKEIQILKPKAEGQMTNLKSLSISSVTKMTQGENERLKAEMKMLRDLLGRKEEEVRGLKEKLAVGRAQVVTRAGSAAPGGAGSPRLSAVGVVKSGRGPGSRGVSPVGVGGGGNLMERSGSRGSHPLRNG